uniref:Uncharacterized protein n=1 Tax=Alexandrium catenella TaxID=2925 RepID=A0A7S1QL71_ALECA|mmetsp:Transcript_34418/g.93227  ORF Transcript_34418/g.93227 Transcript_34418/m.93227 type:complete len:283 (+) Transcript_34418:54-902(+)
MAANVAGWIGFLLVLLPCRAAPPSALREDTAQRGHHAALVGRNLRTGLNEVVSGVEVALSKATDAAKLAWALTDTIKKQAKESLKLAPLVEAEIATVEAAATTAREQDEQATAFLNKTRAAVEKAAFDAAEDYYMKVKLAGSRARSEATTRALEVKVAGTAADAAKPYKESYLRAKKVMMEYLEHARALAAASDSLKAESANESAAAVQYQTSGQVLQAEHQTKMAEALLGQAEALRGQAAEVRAQALRIRQGLPVYERAGQVASESIAAAVRSTATLPPIY